ncbi:FRG domain-containing protein [Variovorax robiniae]|uniref:FRG domain-containing protein n=1 Tax=Variovorax robiniae TaxID=1836199 RepID=A0ABU8XJR8_9BURK
MKEFQVSTLPKYLEEVELRSSHTRIYRGVADPSYQLIPSLGRLDVDPVFGLEKLPGGTLEERRERYEVELLREFKRRAMPFLTILPRSELEWLCLAQHYGVPTRLLDWTINPLVALYFACESKPESGGAVYVRDQTHWQVGAHHDEPFKKAEQIMGIQPDHSDKRFVNQEGVFTLQPDFRVAIDDDATHRIVFNAKAKDHMQWQLAKFGIRASVIYPGLDGVAKDVRALCETTRTGVLREADPYRSLQFWGRPRQ